MGCPYSNLPAVGNLMWTMFGLSTFNVSREWVNMRTSLFLFNLIFVSLNIRIFLASYLLTFNIVGFEAGLLAWSGDKNLHRSSSSMHWLTVTFTIQFLSLFTNCLVDLSLALVFADLLLKYGLDLVLFFLNQ